MTRIIFMFGGQGSHYYQMGKSLFEQDKIFRTNMLKADEICQDLANISITECLYAEHNLAHHPFSRTLLTHPAIFMVQYALGQTLLAQDIVPFAVLGSSLGEFVASVFAGIMSFETALTAVITQAQMLETYCQPGSMIAILGYPASFYYDTPLLHQKSELASINFDSSFVISGSLENLQEIEHALKAQQIVYQKLDVSHGFHSSLINPAAVPYLNFIEQQIMRPAITPFISSACITPLTMTDITSRHFWDIIKLPMNFQALIQALEEHNNNYYLDIGPAGTLATFVKYNLIKNSASSSKFFSILNPYSQNLEHQALENLQKVLKNSY